jgi:hypothetical protein
MEFDIQAAFSALLFCFGVGYAIYTIRKMIKTKRAYSEFRNIQEYSSVLVSLVIGKLDLFLFTCNSSLLASGKELDFIKSTNLKVIKIVAAFLNDFVGNEEVESQIETDNESNALRWFLTVGGDVLGIEYNLNSDKIIVYMNNEQQELSNYFELDNSNVCFEDISGFLSEEKEDEDQIVYLSSFVCAKNMTLNTYKDLINSESLSKSKKELIETMKTYINENTKGFW